MFKSASGYNIRYGCVEPAGPCRGTVVLTGGYNRHIEYYYEAINNWRDRGYRVFAMDWAGQGGSDREFPEHPLRPASLAFEHHARMLHEFTQTVVKPPREKPAFLATHSLGGNIVLRYLAMYEKRPDFPYSGAILATPMIDINTYILPRRVFNRLVKCAHKAGMEDIPLPAVSKMYSDFINARMGRLIKSGSVSRERDAQREAVQAQIQRDTDHFHIGYPTMRWFRAALKSSDVVRDPAFLQSIRTPVLVLASEHDGMVSVKQQERAALYMPSAALVKIHDARHGLWYDTDRVQAQLWDAVNTFTAGLCARFKPRHAFSLHLPEDDAPFIVPRPPGPAPDGPPP
jgi:lysophospholipase